MSAQQGTYLVRHLRVGTVYRDVLSGMAVLVVLEPLYLGQAEPVRLRGLMWNPVAGQHQTVELYDHQLELVEWTR